MKRLILNADDLGLTDGVNRAVAELGRAGAITSATLMANAPETEAIAQPPNRPPGLGIGCHVVLVDGEPLLPSSEIPTLIDPASSPERPRFRRSLGGFVLDLIRGRIREADIEAEATAQIRRLIDLGVTPTHVDTHKHTHMFPRVLRPLLRAAVLNNVACVRNPFEPDWALAATRTAARLRRLEIRLLRTQRTNFLAYTQHIGIDTTDGAVGVLATGSLDRGALERLLRAMPSGTWELVCHPGFVDEKLRAANTRLVSSRETERDALLSAVPPFAASDPDLSLIHFGQLPFSGVF